MTQHDGNKYPVDSETRACCGGIGAHTFDCDHPEAPPINLDPPAPELVRWQELVDRGVLVAHNGDVSELISVPRPAWSDPYEDSISEILGGCYYASDQIRIPLQYRPGEIRDGYFEPATMRVRAKMGFDGDKFVGLSRRETINGKWTLIEGVGLTPAEATELAEALLAAVDLIGGTE